MVAVDPATASRQRCYPSISLLLPLDGETPWPARLRSLQREAITRLRAEFGDDVDPTLLARLDTAVTGAVAPRAARSLAVYVNAHGAECVGVAVPVRQRTVIDDTFATRDLVHHELRSPRYWVLALSLDDPRLLRARGSALHPHPLELRDTAEHPSSDRGRRGRDRSRVIDAQRARRFRALDLALAEALADSTDPLLIVGAEPTIARFLDRTRHITRVEGVLRRAPSPKVEELAQIVAPAVAEVLTDRRVVALKALDQAVGAGTAASGIDEVWHLAHRGASGLLVVEEGFEHPATIGRDRSLTPADDPTAADVVDDVVDDVIELVLGAGGRVVIVPDGALSSHDRIAFVPPPRRRR